MALTWTLGKRRGWLLIVVAVLGTAYALAGFLWAPRLLRQALIEQIDRNLGVTPGVGLVRVNPFLFKVEISDFSVPDPQGGALLGFRRLVVEVSATRSIWHRAPVFSDIEITEPFAHAKISASGSLNVAALKPRPSSAPPTPSSGSLPELAVMQLKVRSGLLSYEDASRPTPFMAELRPIDFELQDFTTGREGGRFRLSGESLNKERLEWRGRLSLQPLASEGEIWVSNLQAVTIWTYLKDQLSLAVSSGVVGFDGRYNFVLTDQPELKLKLENLLVQNLGIRPDPASADWVTLPSLRLRGASLDVRARSLAVDAVELDNPTVNLWLEPGGNLNLSRLTASAPAGHAVAGHVPAVLSTPTPGTVAPSAAWHALVREFRLSNGTLAAEDRSARPVVPLAIAPVNLVLTNASLDEGSPVQLDLDARVNGSGVLKARGTVVASPTAADLAVTLAGFPLASLQPYLARGTSITVLDGLLGGELHVQERPGRDGQGRFLASGNVSVDRLHSIDNTLRDDLVNWDRLTITGLRVQHHPDQISIDTLSALKPYARAIIEPDYSLNIARALKAPGPAPPGGVSGVEAAPPAAAASAAWPVSIRKLAIANGQAQFTDLSILPNFSTGVEALNGTVLGLSSKPGTRAQIDLKGQVDEYSPVTIAGEANLLGAKQYLDLDMVFRNMELTTFNPYSGKFAGYNITKGKLTTELKYRIDDRKLDARHHITIEQLEFGAKTASKDAVSLPVKLAVALLKDRHGVIDLDIPVTGTLDDPSFRLGPLVWKVVVNLLTRIVSSPFALLGKLVGGGPDMQFVDFAPGSAVPDAVARQKLSALTQALVERPQLQIELPIGIAAAADRPALVEARYAQALAPAGADEAAQLRLLARLYTQKVGSAPQYPPAPPPAAGAPAVDVKAAQLAFLQQALRAHITVSDDDLMALAQARAQALQQAMLGGGQVDPGRVFLVANDRVKAQGNAVRLEVSLR
jgi:hypothetical protein